MLYGRAESSLAEMKVEMTEMNETMTADTTGMNVEMTTMNETVTSVSIRSSTGLLVLAALLSLAACDNESPSSDGGLSSDAGSGSDAGAGSDAGPRFSELPLAEQGARFAAAFCGFIAPARCGNILGYVCSGTPCECTVGGAPIPDCNATLAAQYADRQSCLTSSPEVIGACLAALGTLECPSETELQEIEGELEQSCDEGNIGAGPSEHILPDACRSVWRELFDCET